MNILEMISAGVTINFPISSLLQWLETQIFNVDKGGGRFNSDVLLFFRCAKVLAVKIWAVLVSLSL